MNAKLKISNLKEGLNIDASKVTGLLKKAQNIIPLKKKEKEEEKKKDTKSKKKNQTSK